MRVTKSGLSVMTPPLKILDYVVTRAWNYHGKRDYLIAWDIIWGPVWGAAEAQAIRYRGPDEALEAMDTAEAICRPIPWIVPDTGRARLFISPI